MTKRFSNQPSVSKRREEARRRQEAQRRQMVIIGSVAAVALAAILFVWLVLPRLNPEEAAEPTADEGQGETVVLDDERPLAELSPAERDGYYSEYPPMVIDQANEYEAVIRMAEGGEIRLQLFDEESPLAVNNFVYLANQGFYDGTTFHRVLENFMAQGGDPAGTGGGGPGYQFESEVDNGLSFDRRGLLAMANAGPDTNGSQFFITFEPVTRLDGGYTIFGELVEGDEVLSSISLRDPEQLPTEPGDVIERIDIEVNEGS
jgi:cyclophilin family peptidyl-prolyl cis-trans isomerase